MPTENNIKNKLRVSIVEPSGMLYGSELALLDILEELDSTRFEPEVILPSGSPFSKMLEACHVPFFEDLPPVKHGNSKLRKLYSYVRLARRWQKSRPDLIYLNQGGMLRPLAHIARLLDLPILCQVQTLEDAKWVSGIQGSHDHVFSFISNSKFIQSETKVSQDRLSMVYYGYKYKGLQISKQTGPGAQMEVGLLGRIGGSKGHDLVIEAAKRLKAGNCMDFHFRFIGDAPSVTEREQIRHLISMEGLQGLIELRGYRTDIKSELGELDLMIIPSVAEPFGRIFCEAAEAGVPVLASDSGGLGELAEHFGAGVRFSSCDVGDFLKKLCEIRSSYNACKDDFVVASGKMLESLDLKTYVRLMESLIVRAASRQPCSVQWQGR